MNTKETAVGHEDEVPCISGTDGHRSASSSENNNSITPSGLELDDNSKSETHNHGKQNSDDDVQFIGTVSNVMHKKEEEEVVFEMEITNGKGQRSFSTSFHSNYAVASTMAEFHSCSRKRQRSRPFRCAVCLEDEVDGWKGYSLQRCNHRFCVPCLARLVKASTESRKSTDITCPGVECNENVTQSDVRYIFRDDRKAWHTYSIVASMSLLENEIANGGFTRRCPAERCNYTFVFEPGDNQSEGTLFVCPLCESSYCLACKANEGCVGPAHEGSCSERIEQLREQAEERRKFEDWKQENAQAEGRFRELVRNESQKGLTKPCPKCKRLITKNGGCDHMKCCCGHSYNWSEA